eukprot:6178624-Pleurochrysis_carterae.AAC.2
MQGIKGACTRGEKQTRYQRLSEAARDVVGAGDKRNCNIVELEAFPYEEMSAVDALQPLMMFWVVCYVHRKACGFGIVQSEVCKRGPQVHSFLGRFRGGNDFGLARGKSN